MHDYYTAVIFFFEEFYGFVRALHQSALSFMALFCISGQEIGVS
jgi:hypothetical protein